MSDTKNIITFVDHIGRTLLAEFVEKVDNDTAFTVRNPAIIHVQPTQQGQLNVQTIPLYFRDFVSEKNKQEGTLWKFFYSSVVLGLNIENDQRLVDQYNKLFSDAPLIQPASGPDSGKTIKLFDE